ncbi:MAG: DUF401 family protein [Nitrospiraceae bacterium]|nr:DUF401 family protein [Nitrospiraceae bacterium]
MPDLVKIAVTLVFLIILLRKKMQVGYVLLLGSLLLAVLYLMPPAAVFITLRKALAGEETVKLALSLTAIKGFELVLREKDVMKGMMEAARGIFSRRRAFIVSMPVLIGMLPSVGGAYFSAPMVEEATRELEKLSAEEKGFINYWFRHPWEYILPLYPGIVLAAAVTRLGLRGLILANLPYSLMVAATGFFFGMRNAGGRLGDTGKRFSVKDFFSFLPIIGVLMMVILFGVELEWALLTGLAGLVVFFRYPPRDIWRLVRHCLSLDVLVLIAGVMILKQTMEDSGAVARLGGFFSSEGVPLILLLAVLPFVSGLLTGLTVGFVSATFPLLMSLQGGGTLHALSFAFACGFLGVLLSPVHVCLILSREYFKADLWGIYKRIIPSAMLIFSVALGEYLLFHSGG